VSPKPPKKVCVKIWNIDNNTSWTCVCEPTYSKESEFCPCLFTLPSPFYPICLKKTKEIVCCKVDTSCALKEGARVHCWKRKTWLPFNSWKGPLTSKSFGHECLHLEWWLINFVTKWTKGNCLCTSKSCIGMGSPKGSIKSAWGGP
jgi:hypothetical protein